MFSLRLPWVWAIVLTYRVEGQTHEPATLIVTNALVLEMEGRVEFVKDATLNWSAASTNQVLFPGDHLRTGNRSRALVRLTPLATLRMGEFSEIQIPKPVAEDSGFSFRRGIFYFFHRDKPTLLPLRTPATAAVIRGTEFHLQVEDNGRTTLQVLDGAVDLSNAAGQLSLMGGEAGVVEMGQPPRRTAAIQTTRLMQWALYYPAIVDTAELGLDIGAPAPLLASLQAYRDGDLLQALALYPVGRSPSSEPERVYLASLLLSVGQVDRSEELLPPRPRPEAESGPVARAAESLRLLAATVRDPTHAPALQTPSQPAFATEWMAESYRRQSRGDLTGAREAVIQAVQKSPQFGFARARLAELEFGFGRIGAAHKALDESLALSPMNAQAVALSGFLLAAENRSRQAMDRFDQAIAIDGSLGNAWLGRGLARIRQGDRDAGRDDLQVACALEPQRAVLRGYLGKAFHEVGNLPHAAKELDLTRSLDPNDPTAWLYSALLRQQQNQINPAIGDLERSKDLNDNRQIYRSRFLLDQDQAVRGANLAGVYRDAGLTEVSLREATRAVNLDYGNYSAHLFLSESYNALRDPTRFNLRQETPWFSEWLLASLLSPVGGTSLGQNVSQQEYGRFFEGNRFGLVSQTDYRSDGQIRETASQFGRYQRTAYAVDLDYQRNDDVRANNQLDRMEVYTTVKYQLTPQDSFLFLGKFQQYHSGDNFQHYNPSLIRSNFYYNEYQSPGALVGGYHREWAPGIHTLILGGRLANDQRLGDQSATNFLAVTGAGGAIQGLAGLPFDTTYRGQFEIWSGELSQIIQRERHTLVLGGRFQSGSFSTQDRVLLNPSVAVFSPSFRSPPAADSVRSGMERITGYAYWTWEVLPKLRLTPGLAYDRVGSPQNHRQPPLIEADRTIDQVSPKAALTWSPSSLLTVRGAYTRSLGGVSYDESYRLEPTQMGGFSQAFRSLIPESLAGSLSAPRFETAGLGADLHFQTRTYVTLQWERLASDADRTLGVFQSALFPFFATPSSLREQLNYREQSGSIVLNQLIGDEWSLGGSYRFTGARLERRLPDVSTSILDDAHRVDSGDLHQVALFALFNHPAGWFAGTDLNWHIQQSSVRNEPGGMAATTRLPGEEFPQLNLRVGYRFWQRRGEIMIGGLNLTGENYELNPINLYTELPRERVFYVRLRLRF